jgi:hypothetical protein
MNTVKRPKKPHGVVDGCTRVNCYGADMCKCTECSNGRQLVSLGAGSGRGEFSTSGLAWAKSAGWPRPRTRAAQQQPPQVSAGSLLPRPAGMCEIKLCDCNLWTSDLSFLFPRAFHSCKRAGEGRRKENYRQRFGLFLWGRGGPSAQRARAWRKRASGSLNIPP